MKSSSFLRPLPIVPVTLIVLIACAPTAPQPTTPAAAPTPTATGYADVDGLKLYYERYGSGRPTVLLHGALGEGAMFLPIMAGLAAGLTAGPESSSRWPRS